MKKTLSIILSLLLIMCSAQIAFAAEKTYDTPANAYVGYDKAKIAADDKQYIDSMSYDMIAGLLLDWVDGKIAEATQDFQSFEVEVLGQSVAINLDVSSLDGILSYAGYLSQLGGDFANLDITALNGLSRAGGDINFIYGIIQFVADNAEVFGKVFQWEEGQTFDFGLVGQYIEGLEDTNEIKIFYNDYLIGNDIQEKFIAEIAREMGYTVEKDAAGERVETFDEILSNGILNCVADFFKTNNLLSDAGIAQLKAYDLRTEDIYYHFKNLAALVQSDNQVKLDTYLLYIMDSVVRGAMKVMFGYAPVEGEAVSADVVAEFNAAYADLAYLYTISGGTVYFKATSGYAVFKLDADGTILEAKNITWENTMGLTFEVPAMTIYSGGAETTVGGYSVAPVATYTPSENYVFEIYSTYAEMLSTSGLPIAGTTVPDAYAPVMVEENAKAMSDLFAFTVSGITPPAEVVITFAEIEEFAEQKALEMAQQMTQGMNIAGMTPTVTGVDVTLNYQGYATEDEFITVVTGSASANIAVNGIALNPLDVSSVISNPIATIVLDNLSGGSGVADALALLNMLNSDFDVDMTLLDFAGNYDAYNGVIGQVNRVLCGLVKMIFSADAYEELALTEGGNENLTENVQKICTKLDSVFALAKEYMDGEGFAQFVESSGVNSLFASSHGFNANMVYNLDFSNPESLYVCLIEMVLDFIDKEEPGTVVNDLHMAVEGLETLDAIAVAVTDYLIGKAVPSLNEKFAAKGINIIAPASTDASTVAEDGAKDIIMTKLVDLGLQLCTWGVDDLLNGIINELIADVNAKLGFDISDAAFAFGVEKADTWQATLAAMVDRVYALADGIIIVCGTYEGTDTFDKISALVNAIIPMGSMFSNCAGNGFAADIDMILNTFIFDEALDGNFDNFLRLFETAEKTEDVAAGVPATYALIKASDHIVDAIFPGTVAAENYAIALDVQETFTSGDSDVQIAARNMVSLNERKTHIVPAALDLIRESGLLPYFAACEHTSVVDFAQIDATCVSEGKTAGTKCADCGKILTGGEVIAKNNNHVHTSAIEAKAATCKETGITAGTKCDDCGAVLSGGAVIPKNDNHVHTSAIAAIEATCTEDGRAAGTKCNDCGAVLSGGETITALGHIDEDPLDGVCDRCDFVLEEPEEPTFFQKIVQFFQRILNWFRSLFNR